MKINTDLFLFPKSLANDLENFLMHYPAKFPPIVQYFEEVASRVTFNAKDFTTYGHAMRDELFAGFDKIMKDYAVGDTNDLSFLITTDQRFHKLFCYRFWVVNYLFPDGPAHDYFVDVIKNSVRKFTDVSDGVEEFEDTVHTFQRDLLQGDYADLYLQQALSSVALHDELLAHDATKSLYLEIGALIHDISPTAVTKLHAKWDELFTLIETQSDNDFKKIKDLLVIPINQSRMRQNRQPIYNTLTQSIEFIDENRKLLNRFNQMSDRIRYIFDVAKRKLDKDDFDAFSLAYEQCKNFTIFKDIMGEIDRYLLPVWFENNNKIKEILLRKHPEMKTTGIGLSGVFDRFVWYLPSELKDKVMTPDTTPFSLAAL